MGKFKVGDRARFVKGNALADATGTIVGNGDGYYAWSIRLDKRSVDFGHTCDGLVDDFFGRYAKDADLEPVAVAQQPQLTIRAGAYYKTRDGRKVGPMESGRGPWFEDDRGYSYYENGKRLADVYDDEIIAEWVDEPVATNADIFDGLEDWMADNPLPEIKSTTGLTVPMDAPEFGGGEPAEFKVGDRVDILDNHPYSLSSYKPAGTIIERSSSEVRGDWQVEIDGYGDDLSFKESELRLVAEATSGKDGAEAAAVGAYEEAEPDSRLLVAISADASALDAEIDRVLKRLRKLKRKARKMGISLEYSDLREAA